MSIETEYLADNMRLAPTLARWHYDFWKAHLPWWTYADALAELKTHVDRCALPTTVVALERGKLLGSASLIVEDAPEPAWKHLTPWLASVFVRPEARGRGVGTRLVQHVMNDARVLKLPRIYLFTYDDLEFYERLGWRLLMETSYLGKPTNVMYYLVPDRLPVPQL